jgi:uncharacterized protein YndB with AHSA1/START domain
MNYTSVERTSDREIVIARTFDAPARIVFDAWTRPELVRRWWSATSCEADVRVGGHYRYVLKPANCDEFAFSGEYIEITPHSRLVYTAFFEPKGVGRVPDAEPVIVTVTFDEREGRTHLVSREVYPSKQVLDGALASGMEHGLRVTMDQLDELVASLR